MRRYTALTAFFDLWIELHRQFHRRMGLLPGWMPATPKPGQDARRRATPVTREE